MVFGSKPYEDYLSYPLFGGPLRGVFFVIGLLGIIGFLRLVPRQQLFFTKWGKNTLLVYLLQGIFIKGLRALAITELNLSLLGFMALSRRQCFTDDPISQQTCSAVLRPF